MRGNGESPRQSRIETIRRRIEKWRRTRTKRSPMPERLWIAAEGLARKHGVSPTANALNLDYGSLRKRVEAGEEGPAPAGFVELERAAPCTLRREDEILIEIVERDGDRLAFHLPERFALDVAALAESFWNRHARDGRARGRPR